jgi:adenylate cyclase
MSSPPEFENAGARLIGAGDSAYLLGDRFQIGRDPTNDLQLEDREVSRFHAVIQRLNDGQYWITDLISRNGTRVKGESLKGSSQRLEHGDRLRIGDHWFEFHVPSTSQVMVPVDDAQGLVTERASDTVNVSLRWLILFDLVGSTSMEGELTETEVHRIKEGWMREAARRLLNAGGRVNKFLGDGVFGYWNDSEGINGLVAQGLAELREWQDNAQLPFRMVIHFGRVCSGPSDMSGVESITGQAVNLLFRLEKLASQRDWRRVITEPVRSSLRGLKEAPELGQCTVDGIPGQFRLFGF